MVVTWQFDTLMLDKEKQDAVIQRSRLIDGQVMEVVRMELKLTEKKVREALIALGWTPPGEVTVAHALEAVERLPTSAYRSAALDELTDLLGYLNREEQRTK